MSSAFKLRVVDSEGNTAAGWVPGSVAETEFVQTCADAIETRAAKDDGMFTTQAAKQARRARTVDALNELLYRLKASVKPV